MKGKGVSIIIINNLFFAKSLCADCQQAEEVSNTLLQRTQPLRIIWALTWPRWRPRSCRRCRVSSPQIVSLQLPFHQLKSPRRAVPRCWGSALLCSNPACVLPWRANATPRTSTPSRAPRPLMATRPPRRSWKPWHTWKVRVGVQGVFPWRKPRNPWKPRD